MASRVETGKQRREKENKKLFIYSLIALFVIVSAGIYHAASKSIDEAQALDEKIDTQALIKNMIEKNKLEMEKLNYETNTR